MHYTASNEMGDILPQKSEVPREAFSCTVFGMGHFSSFSMLSFFLQQKASCIIVVTSTPNLPKNRGREKLQAILIDAWPKVIYSAIKILGYEN